MKDEEFMRKVADLWSELTELLTKLITERDSLRQEKEKLIRIAGRLGAEPCRCDPVGSGEEYCNGGCSLRQQVKDAEEYHGVQAEQITLLTNDNVSLRQSSAEAIVAEWRFLSDRWDALAKLPTNDGIIKIQNDIATRIAKLVNVAKERRIVLKSQGRKEKA